MSIRDVRYTLNAALNKIVQGDDIEENVLDAVGAFEESAKYADRTHHYMKHRRGGSEWLADQFDYEDLRKVGHYHVHKLRGLGRVTIRCERGDLSVDFLFRKRKDYGASDSLKDMIGDKSYGEGEVAEAVDKVVRDEISPLRRVSNTSEAVLGRDARSLEGYGLISVILSKGKFFSIGRRNFYKKSVVVYKTSNEKKPE